MFSKEKVFLNSRTDPFALPLCLEEAAEKKRLSRIGFYGRGKALKTR
jgi:hypothetical protein